MTEARENFTRRSLAAACLITVCLCIAARTVAQSTPTASQLAGQVDLARLVDLAAARVRVTVEYDPNILKGSVTLRPGSEVTDEELWALMNRLLASRGLTTVRMPGSDVTTVVRTAEAAGFARLGDIESLDAPARALPFEPGFRSAVFRLRNRAPADVIEPIGRILTKPGGVISALGDAAAAGGIVVISDLSPRIDQAATLLRLLDQPAARTVVEEIPIANVAPAALATLATQLAAKGDLLGPSKAAGEVLPSPNGSAVLVIAPVGRLQAWRDLIGSLDRREGVETITYAPTVFAAKDVGSLIEQAVHPGPQPDERWRLVVDELTGTLIVTATPSQHATITSLLERLNAAPEAARRPMRSFVVRNRNIRELADVLRSLLDAGALDDGSAPDGALKPVEGVIPPPRPEPARAQRPAATQARTPGESSPVVISIDEGTNTLIAMGEARLLEQLAALIERLDVRQPQVMLEVLLVSLTDAQTLNLGAELEALDLGGGTRMRVASLFGLASRAADGTPTVGSGSGLTGIVLNPGDFSIVIRALKTINDGRSLSIPKVLVGNNQQATLDSVLEQPFASTNASNTVATTSFGGSSAAGTQVSIRPQIAEGDHLILDYQISLSSFAGAAANANVPPPKQTNKVSSVATIPDGYTVVVGGIDLTNESRAVSQVPLLGSIPVLGEAFKSRSNIKNQTRFYVFIRANVLRARGFEDLKYVTRADAAGAGLSDGFPEVAARVIR